MNGVPQSVEQQPAWHLGEIQKLFRNPKITLIVRAPLLRDGDLIMTDDEIDKVIASLHTAKVRNRS